MMSSPEDECCWLSCAVCPRVGAGSAVATTGSPFSCAGSLGGKSNLLDWKYWRLASLIRGFLFERSKIGDTRYEDWLGMRSDDELSSRIAARCAVPSITVVLSPVTCSSMAGSSTICRSIGRALLRVFFGILDELAKI